MADGPIDGWLEKMPELLALGLTDDEICARVDISNPSALRTALWRAGYGIETVATQRRLRPAPKTKRTPKGAAVPA